MFKYKNTIVSVVKNASLIRADLIVKLAEGLSKIAFTKFKLEYGLLIGVLLFATGTFIWRACFCNGRKPVSEGWFA